jgi:arginine-tRNA-protein transferase
LQCRGENITRAIARQRCDAILVKRYERYVQVSPLSQIPRDTPQFYLTSPTACPYLPGQTERKVFTHLVGRRARELNDVLTQGGFRRSQTIAYRPACEFCRACVSVRVIAGEFRPTTSMRRVASRNAGLQASIRPSKPTTEHFALFRAYLDARHGDGGMADMTVLDFAMMVEDSHVETMLVEYREPSPDGAKPGRLVAVCLTDVLSDGLSMVYSFFDPACSSRSPGVMMILDHISRAAAMNLKYLYLGYWVKGSRKMDYKGRFLPQERLQPEGWLRAEA